MLSLGYKTNWFVYKYPNSMEVSRDFPDPEIISNIQAGRLMEESIKALYRSHFEGLSYYIIRNNGSKQDAEDIFQEVLVSFIELVQQNKFRGESSIRTFLFSMNRHCWLNELKRRGRALVREEKFEKGQERIDKDAAHVMADREGKLAINKMIAALGETCHKILLLFYYENLSMKEILAVTDYENEQVVRNKKYKCLKQLEKILHEQPHLKDTLKNLLNG